MCRRNDELQKFMDKFNSNKEGFIERKTYNELKLAHEKLTAEHSDTKKLILAWKSYCGQ